MFSFLDFLDLVEEYMGSQVRDWLDGVIWDMKTYSDFVVNSVNTEIMTFEDQLGVQNAIWKVFDCLNEIRLTLINHRVKDPVREEVLKSVEKIDSAISAYVL